ncbi:MAG: hypothetical protein QOI04_1009 [Verrucomicrobiota bacterium]
MPLVSVIIPAFNAQHYIGAAIQSVIDQTLADFEVIVVDDGSTDQTGSIVSDFCASDSRIRLITRENGKLARARNTGITAASGRFLAFLDADDTWHPTKLEKQIELSGGTEAGVIFSDAAYVADEPISLPTYLFGVYFGFFSGRAMFRRLYERNAIPISSVLLCRNLLGVECFFDESAQFRGVEDYELWLRLASKGITFFGLKEKLITYRSHSSQMSRDLVSMITSAIAVRKQYQGIADNFGVDVRELKRENLRDLTRESTRNYQYKIACGAICKLWDVRLCGKRGPLSAVKAILHLIATIAFRQPLKG